VAWHIVLSQDPADQGDISPETIVLPIINDSTSITNCVYISVLSPDGQSVHQPSASTTENSSQSHAIAPPLPNTDLHTHSNTHSVPSDDVRSQCPLCFGGDVSGGAKL
jgi:hypothetical protein